MTSTKSQDDFDKAWETIQKEFLNREKKGESNTKIADDFVDLVLQRERSRQGVDCTPAKWEEVDNRTIQKMKNWDTNNPELVLIEKVFRKLVSMQGGDAIQLISDAVEARAKALSAKQSQIAKNPRKVHPIRARIEELVRSNPDISVNKLIHRLNREVGGEIIDSSSDGAFAPVDRNFPPVKISGLSDQLYRAKKKSQ